MEKKLKAKFLVIYYIKLMLKDIVAIHQKEQLLQNVLIELLEIFFENECLKTKMLIG